MSRLAFNILEDEEADVRTAKHHLAEAEGSAWSVRKIRLKLARDQIQSAIERLHRADGEIEEQMFHKEPEPVSF